MTGVQEPDDAQYADDDDSMDLDGNNRFGNDSDSEDSLPDLSFVKASQYKDPKIKVSLHDQTVVPSQVG